MEFNGHFANNLGRPGSDSPWLVDKTITALGEIKSPPLLFRWRGKACIMPLLWMMPVLTTGNYLRQ